ISRYRNAQPQEHKFVFVGGLQRSATTLLADLIQRLPCVSSLSLDNVSAEELARREPWKLNGFTEDYFLNVHRTGGLEGKFVQTAYPYHNLIRETNQEGIRVEAIRRKVSSQLSAQTRAQLRQQWTPYWNLTHPVLLEKTPENILWSSYLQGAFGSTDTSFIFVLRHPLTWALAVRKWVSDRHRYLLSTRDLVAFWLTVHQHMLNDLDTLSNAQIVHAEALASSTATWRKLVTWMEKARILPPDLPSAAKGDIAVPYGLSASSFGYVMCWLCGG
ncbi:hypothetical protein JKP88DRAFT_142783, partial [Tribonema minus]